MSFILLTTYDLEEKKEYNTSKIRNLSKEKINNSNLLEEDGNSISKRDNFPLSKEYAKKESSNSLVNVNKEISSKLFIMIFLIIISSWAIIEQLFYIFKKTGLRSVDFWTLEIVIISYINKRKFNIQIYKHQYLAIFFSLNLWILKIIKMCISTDEKNTNICMEKYRLIPIGIIINIILMIIRSYTYT